MENTINKNKIWWIILSIAAILIIGFLTYSYKDSIKKYLGFATVYDAAGSRAANNGWKINSGSHAWAENVGWIDFVPTQSASVVSDSALWGYAYGENVGWISLNCANGTGSCGTVNYKVLNNGEGKLSGYAWGENIGWVDFGTSTNIGSRPWGVSIDSNGDFTGYAYGENVGWISFNSANGGSVVYKVSTNWRPQSLRPQCNNGIDDDGDGRIDYPDDPHCFSLVDTSERGSSNSGSSIPPPVETFGNTDKTTVEGGDNAVSTTSTSTIANPNQGTSTSEIKIVPPTTKPSVPTPSSGPGAGLEQEFNDTFTRDLYIGISGGDVKELQKFLNKAGYTVATSGVGSAGNETRFYGNRTADAITKLQEANSKIILTPYGLTKGTGYFGKSTRSFVNTKLGGEIIY